MYKVLKKEYEDISVPILDFEPINIDFNLTKRIETFNPDKNWLYFLIDNNSLVGVVWATETTDLLTKPFITFPLTGLIDGKYIFELIKFSKSMIKKLIDKGYKYFSLTQKMKNGKPLAHNKRLLKWFEKNYNKTKLAYNIYNGNV